MDEEPPPRSKLEQKFDDGIHEPMLKPLLPVIQGLMRFEPSNRISASQALDMVSSIVIDESDEVEEETEWDEMDEMDKKDEKDEKDEKGEKGDGYVLFLSTNPQCR